MADQFLWQDSRPNRVLNSSLAAFGYMFFWGTELALLYLLVRELLAKTQAGFSFFGGLAVAWTVVAAYVTLRLNRFTQPSRALYVTQKAIGFSGPGSHEIALSEVEKVIVAQADDGFEVQLTSHETQLRVPLRDRKGFLGACSQIPALKGKVASTGILE